MDTERKTDLRGISKNISDGLGDQGGVKKGQFKMTPRPLI